MFSTTILARYNGIGTVTELLVPKTQNNVILAGLAFNTETNLWVQPCVDYFNPCPTGTDNIVQIDMSILTAKPMDISRVPFPFTRSRPAAPSSTASFVAPTAIWGSPK